MMRKFLMVAAVGALAVLIAAPAMALDFKFGAEYRVRLYDYQAVNFDKGPNRSDVAVGSNNQGNSPRGAQIRVRPRFDVSDNNGNIQATLRFEIGDTEFGAGGGAQGNGFGTSGSKFSLGQGGNRVGNGAGGGAGADGIALETKWAYIDAAMPFNIPLRLRAGIQPWYLPKGLIVDDDFSGIRAYGKINPVSYEAFWFRGNRAIGANTAAATGTFTSVDTTVDNSYDFFGGKIDLAITPIFNPSLYYVYGDNRQNCATPLTTCNDRVRTSHYFGASFVGKLPWWGMSYDLDGVYGSANGGQTGAFPTAAAWNNVHGYTLDAGIHIPIGPVTFNIFGSYTTGDKVNGGKSEAMPVGPGPSWSGPGGNLEIIGEGGAFDVVNIQHSPTNLWVVGGSLVYYPVKALMVKGALAYAGFTTSKGNCGRGYTAAGVSLVDANCYGPAYNGKFGDSIAGKSGLGTEMHIRADYEVWTGFKIQGMAGALVPTKGDWTQKYILQFLYNF